MEWIIVVIITIIILRLLFKSKPKNEIIPQKNPIQVAETGNDYEDQSSDPEEHPEFHPTGIDELNFFNGFGGYINIAIKGLSYKNNYIIEVAKKLRYGDVLSLEMEPSNIKDKYAIKVMTSNNISIGYVPFKYSKELTQMILNGYNFTCKFANSSAHPIPFQYMDIHYVSEKKQQVESLLMNKFKVLGVEETFNQRAFIDQEQIANYNTTKEIIINYRVNRLFEIREIISLTDGTTKTIDYKYTENLGSFNYNKAMYLEKVGNFDDAIKFYLLNIEIGEYLLKSSKRLSVLFKKVNRRHDIAAMYEDALNSANESLLPMATDKLKDELLKYQEEKNDSELSPKRMMKRLRENIANTQKAYDKAISEGKTLIAENAKIRLEKYESELKEIEDNITESSTE